MATLSLRHRVAVIRERFHVPKFSHTFLRALYKKANVKYRRPKYQYRAKMEKSFEIIQKQHEFSKSLVKMLIVGKNVVYVDETSFNLWSIPRIL
jgi:hypothetical protein